MAACEDVPKMARAFEEVLERDDLTTQHQQEIAETLSTRAISFEVSEEVDMVLE